MSENQFNLEELHDALLKLLKRFDQICSKFNILYSIGFGTMLGAIRHKGFIPWDDDVDIIITRENYEKLIRVPIEEYGDDFFLQTVNTDPGYPYNTARLRLNNSSMIFDKWLNAGFNQGIYIDIITLDNVPDNRLAESWQKLQIIFFTPFRFLRNRNVFFSGGKNIPTVLKKAIYAVFSRFPLDKIYKHEVKVESKYSYRSTQRMAFLGEGNLFLKKWYPVRPIQSEYMKDYCHIPFEDTKLMCSAYYEDLLKQWYGDYSKLPPPEKRVVYHHPLYFSSTISYKDYLKHLEGTK